LDTVKNNCEPVSPLARILSSVALEHGLSGELGAKAFIVICQIANEAELFHYTKPTSRLQNGIAQTFAKAITDSSDIMTNHDALTQLRKSLNDSKNPYLIEQMINSVYLETAPAKMHVKGKGIPAGSGTQIKEKLKAELDSPERTKLRNLLLVLQEITPGLLNSESRALLRKIKDTNPTLGDDVDSILQETPVTAKIADWWRGKRS